MSIQQNRKDQHVDLAEKFYATPQPNDFDALRFVHHSFPEINSADVSLQTSFAGLTFTSPFYINGMTGGSPKTAIINHDLATVARETNLAMASGSISAGIKHPETQESFRIIRKTNPKGLIFANLGAEHSLENAKIAVDLLEANALQLHVNAPQELVMPEGERNFNGWLQNIEKIVANLEVPVIIKEVGFGMSQETIQQLIDVGVKTIDISGRGGTNFAQIENARRDQNDLNFTSSGAVTVATVKALLKFYQVDYTAELVYKLSALAHLSLKSNGSFGDLAASAYGGWLAYTCFDRDWVLEQGKNLSIGELIKMPWPNLKIQPLTPPKDLRLLIGWTGTPASTTHLVDLVKEEKEVMNGFYWDFLAESKKCVEGLISAFMNEDFDAIQHAIRKNRVLLQDLSKHSGVIIETAALTQLCELAETIQGAAKSSGAGGGDCGIVLINRRAGVLPLISNWEKYGITNLPLHVFCFDKEQPKALIWEEK